jgi:hypothetical protein
MSNWQQRANFGPQVKLQQGTIQPSATHKIDLNGYVLDFFEDNAAQLRWSEDLEELSIISGGSNYSVLTLLKGSILKLWR